MRAPTCPRCGARLAVGLALIRPPAALQFDLPAAAPAPDPRSSGAAVIARPVIVYRGDGADRESAWWARPDRAVEAGGPLTIKSARGKRWSTTATSAAGAGELCAIASSRWRPDPDEAIPDPDWMTDDSATKAPDGAG